MSLRKISAALAARGYVTAGGRTSILNEAAARRNEEFNNVVGAAKGAWCKSVKAFGTEHFGWAPLFEVGD